MTPYNSPKGRNFATSLKREFSIQNSSSSFYHICAHITLSFLVAILPTFLLPSLLLTRFLSSSLLILPFFSSSLSHRNQRMPSEVFGYDFGVFKVGLRHNANDNRTAAKTPRDPSRVWCVCVRVCEREREIYMCVYVYDEEEF